MRVSHLKDLWVAMRCERAVLEDPKAEGAEAHLWKRRIQRSYEIFIEPVCFFDVCPYPVEAREL